MEFPVICLTSSSFLFRGRRQWASALSNVQVWKMEAWGTRAAVSWCRALVPLVPSLVLSLLLIPGLVPGSIVSSVIAALAPLRHASNLCGPLNLCSLLSAVSLGPPERDTTHDSSPHQANRGGLMRAPQTRPASYRQLPAGCCKLPANQRQIRDIEQKSK